VSLSENGALEGSMRELTWKERGGTGVARGSSGNALKQIMVRSRAVSLEPGVEVGQAASVEISLQNWVARES